MGDFGAVQGVSSVIYVIGVVLLAVSVALIVVLDKVVRQTSRVRSLFIVLAIVFLASAIVCGGLAIGDLIGFY